MSGHASNARLVRIALMTKTLSEDWLAVWLGVGLFALSFALLAGFDFLGWAVTTSVWTTPAKALAPASKAFAALPGAVSLLLTYVFLLAITLAGAKALRLDLPSFAKAFTVVFALAYLSWIAGSWAYIAATPDKRASFGIGWSLNLTNEAGYIVALLVGLADRQFFSVVPQRACRTRSGRNCTSKSLL